ncbi:MAG: uracil phosphoribosyltransferase [Verrucomicrobia bacterium]|nr:MAG: uracil phosphoribosyltransferase [Verrucomicrobiota bacterium]
MKDLQLLRHPLAQHHLAALRDVATPPEEFRRLVRRLTLLLAAKATRDLATKPIRVTTPLMTASGAQLRERIGLVPILRAGLGMVDALLELLPQAAVWHLGVYRDERTLQPVEYYAKFKKARPVDVALVLDPMLATGGSALTALEALSNWGVKRIKLLALIAAPEGVKKIQRAFPRVQIHLVALDRRLNEHGYILPGLGDAGDRTFNARAG